MDSVPSLDLNTGGDGVDVISSLALSSSSNNMENSSDNTVTIEQRKARMIQEELDAANSKRLTKEANKPSYLKSTVSSDADTRFETAAEQVHKRTYESFRVTKQELRNSNSPMKRAQALSPEREYEATQQLKTGPNALVREERLKEKIKLLSAELKVEKKLREEFERKCAALEGKMVGIEMALNRERSMRQKLESGVDLARQDSPGNNKKARRNSSVDSLDTNSANKAEPRIVTVLKERLKDALVETEKHRLNAKAMEQKLGESQEAVRNLTHVIDGIKNSATFKVVSKKSQEEKLKKQQKEKQQKEKQKLAKQQQVRGRELVKNAGSGRQQYSKSPRHPKSKSPRKSPRNTQAPANAKNRNQSNKLPRQGGKLSSFEGVNVKPRKPTLEKHNRRSDSNLHHNVKPEKHHYRSDSNLHGKITEAKTMKKNLSVRQFQRIKEQERLQQQNKKAINSKQGRQRNLREQQEAKYPSLSPVDTFVSVDVSQLKTMDGAKKSNVSEKRRPQNFVERTPNFGQQNNLALEQKAAIAAAHRQPQQQQIKKEASYLGSNIGANGNMMLPSGISMAALAGDEALFPDKLLEENYGF